MKRGSQAETEPGPKGIHILQISSNIVQLPSFEGMWIRVDPIPTWLNHGSGLEAHLIMFPALPMVVGDRVEVMANTESQN